MSSGNSPRVDNKKLQKSGIRYIIKTYLTILIQAIIFFIASGTIFVFIGWVFYGMYVISSSVNLILLYKINPELLNLRVKMQKGTKSWDKIIVHTCTVINFLYPLLTGLDIGRFHWTTLDATTLLIFFISGTILWIISVILGNWAMISNKHFESSVRIQTERDHKVINIGPYKHVRHPGYASVVTLYLAIPLVLGSFISFIPSGLYILLFMIRTYLEDNTLIKELKGYAEYSQEVKYRILPGIW